MSRPSSVTARQRFEYRAARVLSALPPRAQVRLSGKPPIVIDGQTLEPDIQMTLALMERQGLPPIETQPVADARASSRRQAMSANGRPPAVGAVRDLQVDGGAGPLRARLYSPDEPGGPHGLLLFLHGGGFTIGDIETYDAPCRLLCRHMGVHVLSVEYRLAPEHVFPAAVEDAHAALRWALAHAESLGADPRRVAIGGDSAGANLSTVACWLAARAGEPLPALQFLVYPATDFAKDWPSRRKFGQGFFLTTSLMEWFAENYANPEQEVDQRFSIIGADDLSGMPPAFVVTAGFDPLRDEGEAYAEKLREAGTPVVVRRFAGQIHGFLNFAGVSRTAHDAVVEMAGAARALLALEGRDDPPGAARVPVLAEIDALPGAEGQTPFANR